MFDINKAKSNQRGGEISLSKSSERGQKRIKAKAIKLIDKRIKYYSSLGDSAITVYVYHLQDFILKGASIHSFETNQVAQEILKNLVESLAEDYAQAGYDVTIIKKFGTDRYEGIKISWKD